MILLAISALLLFLSACTDSDRYLVNQSEENNIRVSAEITVSFDSSNQRLRADTICPGDSLIFLTNVYPSKSIRNQQYYWTMDGEFFASEYSFKNTITEPGTHEIAFIFVDFFGDTIGDTLSVTVASPPILDTLHIIPANATQGISTDIPINFVWNVNDPDSIWEIYYHFTLQEFGDSSTRIVDTVISEPNFTFNGKLESLKKYAWTVSATNQILQTSEQVIEATFLTKGCSGENSITGILETNSEIKNYPFHLLLTDTLANTVRDTIIKSESSVFNLAPLSPGNYILYASVDGFPDFATDTIRLSLKNDQTLELDSITLRDYSSPSIKTTGESDSITIADTLYFTVKDGGGQIRKSKINILFGEKNISEFSLSNDTLKVPFNSKMQYWTHTILTITATDNSGNKSRKNFIMRPNSTLEEVLDD